MSLAPLRDGPLSARRSERAASLRKRSCKLRALNAITATITQQCGLTPSLETDFDAVPSPTLTPSESRFLDENDIMKGRYFQDSSISISIEAIEKLSPFTINPVDQPSNDEGASLDDTPASSLTTDVQAPVATNTPINTTNGFHRDSVTRESPSVRVDGGPLRPSDVAKQYPEHHPKTVHLPSKEVQEELLRARRESRDELRAAQLRAAEALPADTTSSPSSTVGAWSTATPMPADPSPVTSVGDEAAVPVEGPEKKIEGDGPPAIDNRVSAKQAHDCLLDAHKELARREILGPDVASPDVQLRLEQEQAVKASRNAATAAAPHATVAAATLTETTLIESASATRAVESADQTTLPTDPPLEQAAAAAPNDVVIKSEPPQASSINDQAIAAAPPAPVQGNASTANRITTRVSSGSMRQKSVSEIIGEGPRLSLSSAKRPSVPESSPSTFSLKSRITEPQASRQPHVPTEIEASRLAPQLKRRNSLLIHQEGYEALRGAANDPAKDYLEPLFKMQTYENLPLNRTLTDLLSKASKVVSTSDQFAGIHERQDHRILRRIYALQNANKWSLRQMLPCPEPAAPKTHMDHLLSEMKWMRTDFRQERKMKKQTARMLAEDCAEWVNSDSEGRLSLQIRVKNTIDTKVTSNAPHSPAETNFENGELHGQDDQEGRSPPDLESANEQDDSSEEMDFPATPQYIYAPPSIYPAMGLSLDKEHCVRHLESDEFRHAIFELPLYAPFEDFYEPHAVVQQAAPSVSKFCEDKIFTAVADPIKKRSRYEYEIEDDGVSSSHEPPTKRARVKEGAGDLPEQTDVALFDPENKLLRDRLHSNTAFRPPSEFPMPSSQFYEFRISSQWIPEDDQLLRRLAKDYSFSWSLIADKMSLPSTMSGAADRRTPWECFERWVELESLPNEMRKTLYFKTWNQRIDAAQRNNDLRYQAQLQQQSQTPNQPQNIVRRRTQPLRVEKRRTSRYLHVVDAMRKNARKREQHAHKQAEAQKAASLRKQHENTAPKSVMHTPAEFSRIRHERDVAYAQRQEQHRQQQLLERQRQAAMQQRPGQFPAQQGQPTGNTSRPATAQQIQTNQSQQPGNNAQMAHVPHQVQGQAQIQGQGQPSRPNTHVAVPQMGAQGNIPQAPMQANMRSGNNMNANSNTSNNIANASSHAASDNAQQRMALEQAHRQAQMKQQAQLNGQQFQMGPPNRSSPSGLTSNSHNWHATNLAIANAALAAQNNGQHASTPNGNATHQNHNSHVNNAGASASPHMPPPPLNPQAAAAAAAAAAAQQPQQLSSGHVPAIAQITHQLQAKHPNASQDQIKELTSQHLKHFYSQQQNNHQARQSAMHAAAGTHGVSPSPNNQAVHNQNQAAFQQNNNNVATNGHASSNNATTNGHQAPYANSPANGVNPASSANSQYSAAMRQQLIQQRQNQIQSAAMSAASGSPRLPQASPNMAHASPIMAQAVPNMNGAQNRTPTPQMVRLGSSGGQSNQGSLQSPGLPQGSPRAVPAGVAQRQ